MLVSADYVKPALRPGRKQTIFVFTVEGVEGKAKTEFETSSKTTVSSPPEIPSTVPNPIYDAVFV